MKKLRMATAFLLSLALVLAMVPVTVMAENIEEVTASEAGVPAEESGRAADPDAAVSPAYAETNGICGDDIQWVYISGTLTIMGTGSMYNYTSYKDTPWYSYSLNQLIQSIIIKDGVTSIGDYAFCNCINVSDVTISSSVTSIGNYAFMYCGEMTGIELPSGLTDIGAHAFDFCSGLTDITLPSGLTGIGDYAFSGCGMTTITVPASLTSIGDHAFDSCSQLNHAVLSSGVKAISDGMFCGCTALTSVEIPSSVTGIGSEAFAHCSSLTGIEIPSGVTSIGDAAFSSTAITSADIPEGVNNIGNHMFDGCFSLSTVSIPTSVTTIGDYAFGNCKGLSQVTIPKNVTSIGTGAFRNCLELTVIIFEGDAPDFASDTFSGVTATAFVSCGNSTWEDYLAHPEDYQYTGTIKWKENGFQCGDNLYGTLEEGILTVTGTGEMWNWSSPEEVPWYDYLGNITDVLIGNDAISVGDYAFSGCSEMANVVFSDSVISIGNYAFQYCRSLTNVNMPKNIQSIGNSAFSGCSGIEYIYFWESAPEIADDAFSGVTAKAHYPSQNYAWDKYMWKNYGGKIDWYTDVYSAQRNGWCVDNAYYTFSYDEDYKTSLAAYDIYASSIHNGSVTGYVSALGRWIRDRFGWQGNCFGMGLLSAADYLGVISLKDYFPDNDGEALARYGYNDIRFSDISGRSYYTLIGNSDIITTIERAHVSQFSNELEEAEVYAWDRDGEGKYYTQLMTDLYGGTMDPILVTMEAVDGKGHAVLIDPSVAPVKDGDGWYLVGIYDPNYPQNGYNLDNPIGSYQLDSKSQLLLNPDTGEWTYIYWLEGKEDIRLSGDYNMVNHLNIKFYDINNLSDGYFGLGNLSTSLLDYLEFPFSVVFGCTDTISISDENGTLLDIEENELISQAEDCDYKVIYGTSESFGPVRYISMKGKEAVYTTPGAETLILSGEIGAVSIDTEGESTVTASSEEGTVSIKAEEEVNAAVSFFVSDGKGEAVITADIPEGGILSAGITDQTLSVSSQSELTATVEIRVEDVVLESKTVKIVPEEVVFVEIPDIGTDLSESMVTLSSDIFTYSGDPQTPAVTVKDGDDILTEGIDYTVTYSDNINAGIASVTVTGMGNYTGIVTREFTINKAEQNVIASVSGSDIQVGKTASITVSGKGTISYRSSDNQVAVVNAFGIVTGMGRGDAVITVAAAGDDNYKPGTASIQITVSLAAPVITRVENINGGIKVTWDEVAGAEKYRLYVYGSDGWKGVADTASTNAVFKGISTVALKSGTTYRFTVRCISADGSGVSTYDKTGRTITYIAAPVISSVVNAASGVTVKWNTVSGASRYRVFRKTSGTNWTKIGDTTSATYTDTTAKSGTTYIYTIRCLSSDSKSYTSGYDSKGKTILYLSAPDVKVSNAASGIVVKWNKVTGAKGYYIYRKTGSGKYSKIATIKNGSTVSYTDTSVKKKNGSVYTYAVRAYNGSTLSSYVGNGTVRLIAPSISSASNSASKTISVRWNKNSAASGYQIRCTTGSTIVLTTVYGNSQTRGVVNKYLKKGSTYKVQVRSFRVISGYYYYSDWSSSKTVKVKK